MSHFNTVKKYGNKFRAQLATGAVLMCGSAIALADAASAKAAMEAKEGDIDTIGWAAVGLCVAVAVFSYVKRAAR